MVLKVFCEIIAKQSADFNFSICLGYMTFKFKYRSELMFFNASELWRSKCVIYDRTVYFLHVYSQNPVLVES